MPSERLECEAGEWFEARRFDLMATAEAHHRRRWYTHAGVSCLVVPFSLYQQRHHRRIAAGVWVMHSNGLSHRECVYPVICSLSLRRAMYRALCTVSKEVHALSVESGPGDASIEITGDILCRHQRTASAAGWQVRVVICRDPDAGNTVSDPSCALHRTCTYGTAEDKHIRRTWCHLGEFHSHPQHDPALIKPPSNSDLYQMLLAADNGVHGCTAVLAPEGVYWYGARLTGMWAIAEALQKFFDKHRYTPAARQAFRSRCRQPLKEIVTADLLLLYDLRQLEHRYFELMHPDNSTGKKHRQLAAEYHDAIETLGVDVQFLPWQSPNQCSRWRTSAH